MWTEIPKGKNKKPVNKDRFISKMFLRYEPILKRDCLPWLTSHRRGDSVILSEHLDHLFYG